MKNKKVLIMLPICILALGVIFVQFVGRTYANPIATIANYQSTTYYYIRRNMMTHHFIKGDNYPSGTIMIKDGSPSSNTGNAYLVYCAHKNKTITKASSGHYYDVPISQTKVTSIRNAQENLTGLLVNSYPYISLATLKQKIKAGIGEAEYNKYAFDTLDVQEAITATQAAVWNAIDNTTGNVYGTTKGVGKQQYKYFHRTGDRTWEINWDAGDHGAYNIQTGCNGGCGSKKTILQDGDTKDTAGSYKPKGTALLEGRINRLITWYKTLNSSNAGSQASVPNFTATDANWTNQGKTLEVTIKANNDTFTYAVNNDYKVVFTDLAGKTLSNVSSSEVKDQVSSSKTIGYKYTINDITTKGVIAKITAVVPSTTGNVYVYESTIDYSKTQYLIGVKPGNVNVSKELNILNDAKGKVYVYKTAGTSNSPSVTYGNKRDDLCTSDKPCLSDARFVIYAENGTTVLDDFITTDKPYETSLPLGTYYIQEVDSPIGYVNSTTKLKFEISDDNTIAAVYFPNTPTLLCIKKVSTEDKNTILDGGRFEVRSSGGVVYEDFISSNQEGVHCLKSQLESGIWYIAETEAPPNYFKTNEVYRVKVGNVDDLELAEEVVYEDVVDLELIDNTAIIENKPGVAVSKSDLSTGACVTGAKLVIRDSEGNEVDTWTSTCEDGKDKHLVDLDPGNYTLTEDLTPTGYATAETIEFTIDENGKASTTLDMKDAPIEVCINKVSGDKEGLPGAEFEIYDSKGKLYEKFTSTTSPTCFPYMPIGKYTIKETKAPAGYAKIDKDIEITVEDTAKRQSFDIENEMGTPKTALDYSQIIIVAASIFMIFGLGLVGYYGYKKHN